MISNGKLKQCLLCKKDIYVTPYIERIGGGKYCSYVCSGKSRRGISSWNKGKEWSDNIKKKMSEGRKGICFGISHWQWKGESVSYRNLHKWVQRYLGKPDKCSLCGGDTSSHRYHFDDRQFSLRAVDGKYL